MLVGSSADFSPLLSIRRQIEPKENLVEIMIAVNKRHQTTFNAVLEIRFFIDWLIDVALRKTVQKYPSERQSNPNHHFSRIFLSPLEFHFSRWYVCISCVESTIGWHWFIYRRGKFLIVHDELNVTARQRTIQSASALAASLCTETPFSSYNIVFPFYSIAVESFFDGRRIFVLLFATKCQCDGSPVFWDVFVDW